jgi:polyhydroxyalkanoate synthesis repressor PhaR
MKMLTDSVKKKLLAVVPKIKEVMNSVSDEFTHLFIHVADLDPKVDFRDADMRGVDFGNADLSGFDFTGSDLSGADFRYVSGLERAILKEAITAGVKWPLSYSEGNEQTPSQTPDDSIVVIKRYATRRLYNTAVDKYVSLEELAAMARGGEDFVVYDAKTGEDITRSVLTQIILEEDGKGRNLLPIGFLRQLISYYDDSLHAFLPRYLELSMENFARHQDQMRGYMEETFGRFFPIAQFEEMARQNMALFAKVVEHTMTTTTPDDPQHNASYDEVRELKRRIDLLQKQFDAQTRGLRKSA